MKQLRVLVAEDEPVIAEGLGAILQRLGHTVVGTVYDGGSAVARAQSLNPDLVLLDIKMPRLDGVEAAHQIMAHRPAPIILVTAYTDPDLIQRATTEGVMAYLVKPVTAQHLEATIPLAVSRFTDLIELRKSVQSLKEALALRQQVERAKGVLAHRLHISEAAAHERLQRFAKRDRCTIGQAAARILSADTFFADLESLS